VLFQTASLVGASYARRVWQLFLSQGACFGAGLGFLFVASVGVVPQWFRARRSLASGVAAAGSGFGGLAYSLAAGAMIARLGLPWAFRILAVVSFVVNLACAVLLRDRNAQLGSSLAAFDVRLFRRVEFWLLLGFGFFSMLGYVVLLFSIPNYARRVGLSAHQGSVVCAVLNLGQGLGRPPIGYFSDTVGRINIAAMLSVLSSVLALVLWIQATRAYGVRTTASFSPLY
jgi:MFS family permease